jgi:hypothetical protein
MREMAVGPDGVFVVGDAVGTTTFDGVTIDVQAGGVDGFVLALDADLRPRWARQWRWWRVPNIGIPLVECRGVAALADGGCAVTGATRAGADIEHERVGSGGYSAEDGAVARYAADGDLVWVLGLHGTDDQSLDRVAVDAEGCLLIPGSSQGAMQFRDRDGTVELVNGFDPSSPDAFLLRLDPDGRLRWGP